MKNAKAEIESKAEKWVKKGKIDEAVREYNKLLEMDDKDVAVRTTVSDLLIKFNLVLQP